MNNPEQLPNNEALHDASPELHAQKSRLQQTQVDRVVTARVQSLRTLIGKISPSQYEVLAAKVEREKVQLDGFVLRKDRAAKAEELRAQDLDERYFTKKKLSISHI